MAIQIRGGSIRTTTEWGSSVNRRQSDEVRNAPITAQELSLSLEFLLLPLVLPPGLQHGKPDVAGQKSQREGGATTEGDSPDIIVYVNATTEEQFVPHVLCAEVADGTLQLALLYIAAPEALAPFAIDLDEERIDALRLGPVAVGCDRHQRDHTLGANVGLGFVLEDEQRGADGSDEVPHCLLHLQVLGQTCEAVGRIPGVDPQPDPGGVAGWGMQRVRFAGGITALSDTLRRLERLPPPGGSSV